MTEMATVQPFSYGELETGIAEAVQAAASRIRDRHRGHVEAILETGRDLLRVKQLLPHGQFAAWLDAEFRWDERTAQRYMGVASELGDVETDKLSDLDLGAVYALSAKSTPSEVREAVVQRLEAGERVASADIKTAVQDARDAARKERKLAKMSPSGRREKKKREASEAQLQAASRKKAERRHAANERVAEILRERLGDAMHEFLAAWKDADWWEVMQLLRNDGEREAA